MIFVANRNKPGRFLRQTPAGVVYQSRSGGYVQRSFGKEFCDKSKGLNTMRGKLTLVLALCLLALQPIAAQAYIGPGVASGALAAVVGVLGSIFLALFAIIYYPIKRMMKGRKAAPKDAAAKDPAE